MYIYIYKMQLVLQDESKTTKNSKNFKDIGTALATQTALGFDIGRPFFQLWEFILH